MPWGCLCETHRAQRAACAAVPSVKYNLMVQTGLNGFWRLIIAPQVPPLEIWVNSLYPKCPVLSACVTFCHPFVPVLPGEKQPPAAYPDCLYKYRVPAPLHSPYQNKKRKEKMFFLFPRKPCQCSLMVNIFQCLCVCAQTHTCIDVRGGSSAVFLGVNIATT